MTDLSTKYLGLELKNPVIVGSCGLTDNVKSLKELEKNGAAAVVLKSIFEEEINMEYEDLLNQADSMGYNAENLDYFDYTIKEQNLNKYLTLITEAKKSIDIPVIASINCVSSHEWSYFAKKFEEAGADAIELNMFILPTEFGRTAEQNEELYISVIEKVRKEVSIPIALKISFYFSNLGSFIQRLSKTGIDGIVLFNRYFSPDFDIEKLETTSSNVFSNPSELLLSLRWISIMSRRIECDLAASTGVHDGTSAIKQILAGANAVQVVSALYENGSEHIQTILSEIDAWMERKAFTNLNHCRGLLSQVKSANPALYERVQFMKYFSGKF